jgi:hypothetical protein
MDTSVSTLLRDRARNVTSSAEYKSYPAACSDPREGTVANGECSLTFKKGSDTDIFASSEVDMMGLK